MYLYCHGVLHPTHIAGLLDLGAWIECCAACLRAKMGLIWTSLISSTTAHGSRHFSWWWQKYKIIVNDTLQLKPLYALSSCFFERVRERKDSLCARTRSSEMITI